MMMKMNKRRKKSGMSMDKGMKYAKSSKKGMEGDDMLSMDSMPVKKAMGGMMRPPTAAQVKPAPSRMPTSPAQVKPASPLMRAKGGMVSPRKKMAMGYANGGMVESRGNGAARGKKTRIC
jgi:hypothetical protein